MMKSSLFLLLLIFSSLQSHANGAVDAPPRPPQVHDEVNRARPPHSTAVIILDPYTLEQQSQFIKKEGPQEIPEEYWHWQMLNQLGQRLVADGLMKSIPVVTRGAKSWMSDETYRDFRIGYTTDPEGKPTLLIAFPVTFSLIDFKYQTDMVDEKSHILFRRILAEFKAFFLKSYNPTVLGTVTYGDTQQPFRFRFHPEISGLKLELVPGEDLKAKSFMKKIENSASSCKFILR